MGPAPNDVSSCQNAHRDNQASQRKAQRKTGRLPWGFLGMRKPEVWFYLHLLLLYPYLGLRRSHAPSRDTPPADAIKQEATA